MKSIANKLLLTNLFLIVFLIVMNYFWDVLGFKNSFYFLILILVYGMSSAGIVAGYMERKAGNRKASFGMIGNLLLTLIIILISVYVAINNTD